MGDRTGKRLFSEKQIGALIKRATELQEERRDTVERGLSLAELEQMSAEFGIDPKYLRKAALELEQGEQPDGTFNFWGGPFWVEEKRIVEGVVSEDQWESIVGKLRNHTGSIGKTAVSGSAREWSRSIKDMSHVIEQTQVRFRQLDRQTAVEVRKHYRGGAFMAYFFGIFIGSMLAGILIDGSVIPDLISIPIVAAGGLGGAVAARQTITAFTRRQRKKMKGLMNWLHETVQSRDSHFDGRAEIDSAGKKTPEG